MSRPPVISILIVVQKHCTYHHQYSNSLARTTYHNIELMAVNNDSDFTNLKTLNHRLIQVNFFRLIENLDYVEGSHHKTRVIDLYFVTKIFNFERGNDASKPMQH